MAPSAATLRLARLRSCFLAASCIFLSAEAVRESLTYALELQDLLSEEEFDVAPGLAEKEAEEEEEEKEAAVSAYVVAHGSKEVSAAVAAREAEVQGAEAAHVVPPRGGEAAGDAAARAAHQAGPTGSSAGAIFADAGQVAAESSSLGPPHVEIMSLFSSALAALLQRSSDVCAEEHLAGCNQGCQCAWFRQCYPHHLPGSAEVDAGVCAASLPLLVLMSLALILSVFAFVVVLRLVLQHRQYLHERAEHEELVAKRMAGKATGRLSVPTEASIMGDPETSIVQPDGGAIGTRVSIVGDPETSIVQPGGGAIETRFSRDGRPKEDWESASEDEEQNTGRAA